MENYTDAIETYDKAIFLDPNDSIAYNNKGLSYHMLGKYDKAIELYDISNELDLENKTMIQKSYI